MEHTEYRELYGILLLAYCVWLPFRATLNTALSKYPDGWQMWVLYLKYRQAIPSKCRSSPWPTQRSFNSWCHCQLHTTFLNFSSAWDAHDANGYGLPSPFPKLKFCVYKARLLPHKRSVHTQTSIALYINSHVHLPESTNIKPLTICQLPEGTE